MSSAILIQRPEAPEHLILLFHGYGAAPDDLVPLGERLAREFPRALVASIAGTEPCEISSGRQWFSLKGISDENRAARIALALRDFNGAITLWQQQTGLGATATTLVGFSQGAMMALGSLCQPVPVAHRVAAIAGRFATLPERLAAGLTVHLLHGADDSVVAAANSSQAFERLHALGVPATLDLFPDVGHGITPEMADTLVARLRGAG
ncbi:esterase [Derxia gummosa]|uniref:Esterase n=1 Tax=Derxia gummosa DSM 723 TaxID=1121388 RepID=A0A8B6X7L1_9BURK|nr:esterase [Derxia gummosa]